MGKHKLTGWKMTSITLNGGGVQYLLFDMPIMHTMLHESIVLQSVRNCIPLHRYILFVV
jgi:hypothetical protein